MVGAIQRLMVAVQQQKKIDRRSPLLTQKGNGVCPLLYYP